MNQNNIEIKQLTVGEHARWDEYLDTHPEGTFFHQSGWDDIFQNTLKHRTYYLYAEQSGEIVGILPLVHIKSFLFGNNLTSLPFASTGGPLANSSEIVDALEQHAIKIATDLAVGTLEFRLEKASGKSRPVKDLYETFEKSVLADEESNMQAIRSKQRNIIRKGIKNGLEHRVDTVDNFYHAYAESVRNLGTPVFPQELFSAINRAFPETTEFFSAWYEGRVISSAMLFYYRDTVCPYYWGGVWEARQLKGNDYLAWQIMCRAAEKGCTRFDFGRSKKETGSYQWKQNLGFESRPLYYEYELIKDREMPNLSPTNPKYKYFIETWKRLPLPVSRMLGPMLSKYLG